MSEDGSRAGAALAAGRGRPSVDAAARAQIKVLRHYAEQEQTVKVNQLQLDAMRRSGRHSTNLLMRAMQLERPIFADGTVASMGSSASSLSRTSATRYVPNYQEPPAEDLVNGGPGELLSRGAVPSVVPGRYSFTGVPDSKDWSAAAARQKELKQALSALEEEIKATETTLMSKTKNTEPDPSAGTVFVQDPNVETSKHTPVIKSGSRVLGSSFKWSNTQSKSLNVEKFAWPATYDHTFKSWPVGATKYGELSHECDVPGGSIYVKHGLGGKKKRGASRG